MWRTLTSLVLILWLAACAHTPLPPTPADIEGKKFLPLPDKSVIYIVRPIVDSDEVASLALDASIQITTLPRTYYRWEVAPGSHLIEGVGFSGIRLALKTEPGKIYYLVHTVYGTMRMGATMTALQPTSDEEGRRLVLRAQRIP